MRDWGKYVRENLPLPEMKRLLENEIVEEVASQLEDCYLEAIDRGASEQEADALAREHITDWEALAMGIVSARRAQRASAAERRMEDTEQSLRKRGRRWAPLADLSQDVRFSLRTLSKRPLFTLVAVLTLGLGIGATTAIFSVVDGVLIRDLPYEDPGSLVNVWQAHHWLETEDRDALWDRVQFSFQDYLDFREAATLVEDVAVFAAWGEMALTGVGTPEQLSVGYGSANLFHVLGVKPFLGRGFLAGEDADEAGLAARVAVLSHELWRRRFGGDPAVLGTTLDLDGRPYTVVGVLPPRFRLPSFMVTHFTKGSTDVGLRDLWVPIGQEGVGLFGEGNAFEVLARLSPGVTIEQARSEAQSVLPDSPGPDREVRIGPRRDVVTEEVGTPLLFIMGAAALLLIIACANVATLLLGEATGRRRELATRSAVGAGQFRVARQLLTESVILGLLGSGVGILLALYGTEALVAVSPPIPRLEEVEVSGRVLLFAIGMGSLTGLLFGLAPLMLTSRDSIGAALVGRDRMAPAGSRRLQGAIVSAQLALTVVLLVAAGLFTRSLFNVNSVDPGFDPKNLASFYVVANGARYSTQAEVSRLFEELVVELGAVPGVVSVAGSHGLPFPGGGPRNVVKIEGRGPEQGIPVRRKTILPTYHETLGIPVLAGRYFSEADGADDPKAMIISESMARRFWPDVSPVGSTLSLWNQTWNIVGVVGDVRHTTLRMEGEPTVYIPLAQAPRSDLTFVVRTVTDAAEVIPLLREAVWSVDPDMPVARADTMASSISQSTLDDRYRTLLTLIFAALAVVLAAVGIFGVTARSVAQRTREIGIRMALGARERGLVGLFLRRSFVGGLTGIAIGMAAAAWVSRLLSHFLFGVEARDFTTYGAVAFLLLLVCLAASAVPATRAARVAPMDVLREE